MNMNRVISCLTVIVFLLSTENIRSESEDNPAILRLNNLVRMLSQHSTYQLDFKQTNTSATTGQIIEGAGVLLIQKPDRFDWTYSTPPRNRITSDGNYIVMLMPATRQAMTEKASAQSVIWSPISILTHENLEDHFKMEVLNHDQQSSRFRLTSLLSNQPYEYLEISLFADTSKSLFILTILDLAGNTNILEFSNLVPVLDNRLIVFPPIPAGYDVTDFQGNPQDFRFF